MGILRRLFGSGDEGRDADRGRPDPRPSAPHPPGAAVTVPYPVRAPRPGDLAALPGGLPPGRLVDGTAFDDPDDAGVPVLWCSDAPGRYGEVWAGLVRAFPETGLWPLALDREGHDLPADDVLGRPQSPGDPAEVFERLGIDPAPASPPPGGTVDLAVPSGEVHLMLVPVTRPADVPAALGWLGPANHDLDGADVSAVVRSWEDRYGAVVTGVGFDTLVLDLPHPPGPDLVDALAAEHDAFCPDNVDQGVGQLAEYAPSVRDPRWSFWWD